MRSLRSPTTLCSRAVRGGFAASNSRRVAPRMARSHGSRDAKRLSLLAQTSTKTPAYSRLRKSKLFRAPARLRLAGTPALVRGEPRSLRSRGRHRTCLPPHSTAEALSARSLRSLLAPCGRSRVVRESEALSSSRKAEPFGRLRPSSARHRTTTVTTLTLHPPATSRHKYHAKLPRI